MYTCVNGCVVCVSLCVPGFEDATEGLVVGDVYRGVVLVSSSAGGGDGGDGGGGGVKRMVDAAGYGISVEDYGAWEDGVKKGAVGLVVTPFTPFTPPRYSKPPTAPKPPTALNSSVLSISRDHHCSMTVV